MVRVVLPGGFRLTELYSLGIRAWVSALKYFDQILGSDFGVYDRGPEIVLEGFRVRVYSYLRLRLRQVRAYQP